MHPSYFQISKRETGAPKRGLTISAETSEWLFHIKFWDAINRELKSNFGQYEDDILPSTDALVVLAEIDKLRSTYLRDPTSSQTVIYGWTPGGKNLEFSVSGVELSKSIDELRSFILEAIEQGSDVFCQL